MSISEQQFLQTDILGVLIDALTMDLTISAIEGWIERGEKHYVCICNVHSVMEAQRDPAYMTILNNAGLRTPDGMPLVWLSRRAGSKHVERVCGPDLLPQFVARSNITSHRHCFYGGGPGVADELVTKLAEHYPGAQITGSWQPPLQPIGAIEPDNVIDQINATCPHIVWVGLGGTKQDIWAANHLDRLNACAVIAVGAAFDFHAGRIKRAPKWMQASGIEWLYRFWQEPLRLGRRYVVDNIRFVTEVSARSLNRN